MQIGSERHESVVAWLRSHAIPLATVEAGNGFADLQQLRTLIADARVVALGEATHGSREFFQLKHRLVEFLVTEMGFTTFAMEANWPEALAVNDYVLQGREEPAKALAGLRFWTWNTEEVLALIRWMHQANRSNLGARQLTFAGFDAQFTRLAAVALKQYLDRVDPEFAAQIAPRLAFFEKECRDYSGWAEADMSALLRVALDVEARLRTLERDYVVRSTVEEWRRHCQHARILRQVDEQRRAGTDEKQRYMIRDRAMAENVAWILDSEGPQSKVVLWAHNAHVARDSRGVFDGEVVSMGMHLARRLERELVVVGFAFGQGSFQAVVHEEGGRRPIRGVSIGPAPVESFDATLACTGMPRFMIDLRHVDESVASWFREPQVTREIGAFFEGEEDMRQTIVPSARYDALAFIAETNAARPNQRT